MSSQNINLVRRLFDEVYTKGNFALLDELMAPNIKLYDPARPQHREGLQAFKEVERIYKQAFPTKKLKIDDIFASEDKVVARWTCQGTHKGELEGISPTNRDFKISGITIYRFTNGKIVEIWQTWDRLGLLEQLGEIEPATALHS